MAARPPMGNLSFRLLDTEVVAGRGDEPALEGTTFARLLEDVAAFAGVLAAVGVATGERVLVDLAYDDDAVMIALATARLGAVVVPAPSDDDRLLTLLDGATPAAAVSDRPERLRSLLGRATHRPGTLLVRGDHGSLDERHELAWDIAERAGRTDPAAAVQVPVTSAYSLSWPDEEPVIRSLADELVLADDTRLETAAAWRALLLG